MFRQLAKAAHRCQESIHVVLFVEQNEMCLLRKQELRLLLIVGESDIVVNFIVCGFHYFHPQVFILDFLQITIHPGEIFRIAQVVFLRRVFPLIVIQLPQIAIPITESHTVWSEIRSRMHHRYQCTATEMQHIHMSFTDYSIIRIIQPFPHFHCVRKTIRIVVDL